MTAEYAILACWAIFLLYWLVSSWSVKANQEVTWHAGRFRWFVIGLVIADVALKHLGFSLPVHMASTSLVPHSSLMHAIGVLLAIIGLLVALLARKTLAGNWSQDVALKQDHELITTGPYHYARHPIYTGLLLMGIGSILAIGTLNVFIAFLMLFMLLGFKLIQEEKLLARYFPEQYPAYKKHVKALIPYLV